MTPAPYSLCFSRKVKFSIQATSARSARGVTSAAVPATSIRSPEGVVGSSPASTEALDDDVLVDAGVDQDPVDALGGEVVGQLVLRLDGHHVGDRSQVGNLFDRVGLHPDQVGEVGGVAEHLGPVAASSSWDSSLMGPSIWTTK